LKAKIWSVFLFFGIISCAPLKTQDDSLEAASMPDKLTKRDRIFAMRKASVWTEGSLEKIKDKNLYEGPEHDLFNKHDQDLACTFVEPKSSESPPGGRTPKFGCNFDYKGETKKFKVKYDPYYNDINETKGKRNYEVYGEVLSTRLMWALGFPADSIYTAKVTCLGCPLDPWLYMRKKAGVLDSKDEVIGFVRMDLEKNGKWEKKESKRVFNPAVIEVKYSGDDIAYEGVEGWDWAELFEHMDNPEVQKPQREALTILMAFMNHMDNKAEQQRLSCLKGTWQGYDCTQPVMLVQDAGSNFGNGWAPLQGDVRLNKLDLNKWSKLSVWKDMRKCIVKVQGAPNASFKDSWQVSESGRQFLAKLMAELSREQITQLFSAARIGMTVSPDSSGNGLSVKDWVDAFIEKMRLEIIEAKCDR
jgi:hypothetical protein